jgi:hypothetical protein
LERRCDLNEWTFAVLLRDFSENAYRWIKMSADKEGNFNNSVDIRLIREQCGQLPQG